MSIKHLQTRFARLISIIYNPHIEEISEMNALRSKPNAIEPPPNTYAPIPKTGKVSTDSIVFHRPFPLIGRRLSSEKP